MKKGRTFPILLMLMVLLGAGCSADSVTDKTSTGSTLTTTSSVGAIALSASPSSLSALGTAAITATVTDSLGAAVVDGTSVSFSITTNASLGTVTSTATTVSGVATATFTGGSTAGTVVITATAGGVSQTVSITILGVDVGSIEFSSATPNAIGVKGSGQPETSIIAFTVRDVNGQLAADGTNVTFSLDGPNGGEFLTPLNGSTVNGIVLTTLQAGSVAGPVRVTASTVVGATTISTGSTGVSIGGGVPNLPHMTITTGQFNLAGLSTANLTTNITVFNADRFGNYNVLEGTSVSFYTEAGAIDASSVTDATGIATSVFRTQNPDPLVYSVANPYAASLPPTTGDPVNGQSAVIAVTRGEECFVDNNGNGVYDSGTDTFPGSCDIGEPFVDENDNATLDSTEFYVDGNANGVYDGGNGIWDGNIMIWKRITLTLSDVMSQVVLNPSSGFAIANAGSLAFTLCLADLNSNAPMKDNTVTVTASKGTMFGGGTLTTPDIGGGPYCTSFSIEDSAPTDTDPPASLIISVEYAGVTTNFSGTID